MAGTITGNIIWDLVLFGGLAGVMLGFVIWGGLLGAFYWNVISRLYPIKVLLKRPTQEGEVTIFEYGRKRKDKDSNQQYLELFRTKCRTDPIENEDLIKDDRGVVWFYGYQTRADKVIPLRLKVGFNSEGIVQPMALLEPEEHADRDVFRTQSVEKYARDVRYKGKNVPFWMNPVIAQYIGMAILVIAFFIGSGIFLDKAKPWASDIVSGATVAGTRAGIEAGIKTYFGLQSGNLNVTFNESYVTQVPPDVVNNVFSKMNPVKG